MAVIEQEVTAEYAMYNGDSLELMADIRTGTVPFSMYSPPFAKESGGALYQYSSSERDLSNSASYREFFEHYGFMVRELARVTMPGRVSIVHCTDIPSGNSGCDYLVDFPGDIIRLHRQQGFQYFARYHVWKEPLEVRNRTLTKGLAHKTVVDDSSRCSVASADYMLAFRREGRNAVPIAHPQGLMEYAGSRCPPAELLKYRGWVGSQIENRYSHWIWRQYASAFWDDIRLRRVLPFRKDVAGGDEKHPHPLYLDAIHRALVLFSNPGEAVFTPCMGVGSLVYEARKLGRRGIGAELKTSSYRQALANMNWVEPAEEPAALSLFGAAPRSGDSDLHAAIRRMIAWLVTEGRTAEAEGIRDRFLPGEAAA
jgi:hypothetical protein